LEAEINSLAIQAKEYQPIYYTEADIERHIYNLRQLFERGTYEEQRAFLRSFVQKIIVTDNDISIELIASSLATPF
jgi:hypothetical protein